MLRRFAISLLLVWLALPGIARTRPHYGGTLRMEMESDAWQRPDGLARRFVFDGLMALDADGVVRPALAIEAKSENDNHRWTLRLRPGVHFHDGSPLTSTSVVASLTAACASGCPWTSIHAVGSSVIFVCDSPMPNLPQLLAGDAYRIALMNPEDANSSGNIGSNIGTGPFQFTSFSNGVLTLSANDVCWQGRPFLDAIEIRTHRSIRDQWLDLSVGRADVVEVPAEQLRQAHEQRLAVVVSSPVTLLALQMPDSGMLANPNLRAAIALAVDRGALSNVIFQKQGEVTASLLPQTLTGYSFLFPVNQDLNKAHEVRGGLTAPMLILGSENNDAMQLAAQRLALNLHEAGFNVQVTGPLHHADVVLRRIPVEGASSAAALEFILRSVGETTPVPGQESASLYQVERGFLDRHTVVPLLYLPRAFAVSGRVRDLRLGADGIPNLANAALEDAH